MKKSLFFVLAGVTALGVAQFPTAFGQDLLFKKQGKVHGTFGAPHGAMAVWEGMDDSRMEALAATWRDASSDKDRAQVKKVVADWLSREFDEDLKHREAELERIEERVAKLRDQLDRRMESKDDIIDLQIKRMTMTWEGLGWEQRDDRAHFPGGTNVATAYSNFSVARSPWDGGNDGLTTLIKDAIEREDEDAIEFFGSKLQKSLAEMNPGDANAVLWGLYEETKDSVSNESYWEGLAEAGAEAVERFEEEGQGLANTLDTVAHLYEMAGDLEKALEYQQKAVEASESHGPFGTDADLRKYYEELKEKTES